LWQLTQADPRSAAILVNELDARHFQGTPNPWASAVLVDQFDPYNLKACLTIANVNTCW
jgi:hypothetical protein